MSKKRGDCTPLHATLPIQMDVQNMKPKSFHTAMLSDDIYAQENVAQRHHGRCISAGTLDTRTCSSACYQHPEQDPSSTCMHVLGHRHSSYTGETQSRRDTMDPRITRRWAMATFDTQQLFQSLDIPTESSSVRMEMNLDTLPSLKASEDLQQDVERQNKTRDSKVINVFSMAEELSKMNMKDFSIPAVTLQDPNTPASSYYTSSIIGSEISNMMSHRMSSVSIPVSLIQRIQEKENENDEENESVSRKEKPTKASLFRRSIYGNYIPEHKFKTIKSSLKDMLQNNKELRRQTVDFLSLSQVHPFPMKTDTKHEPLVKPVINNYTNDRVNFKTPVLTHGNSKSNILLYPHKENQHQSVYSNKPAEYRISLQETLNINNSIDSRIEDNKAQEYIISRKKSVSMYTYSPHKNSYDKYISKEKNLRNTTLSVHGEKINDENLRPDDSRLSNINSSDYSKCFLSKTSKSYSSNHINIYNVDNTDKQAHLGNSNGIAFQGNPLSYTPSRCTINSDQYSVKTLCLNDNTDVDLNSNDLTSWLNSIKSKYQNKMHMAGHSSTDSVQKYSASQSICLSQLDNNSDIDTFSFSKLSNKSFFNVKKTLASLKKK